RRGNVDIPKERPKPVELHVILRCGPHTACHLQQPALHIEAGQRSARVRRNQLDAFVDCTDQTLACHVETAERGVVSPTEDVCLERLVGGQLLLPFRPATDDSDSIRWATSSYGPDDAAGEVVFLADCLVAVVQGARVTTWMPVAGSR